MCTPLCLDRGTGGGNNARVAKLFVGMSGHTYLDRKGPGNRQSATLSLPPKAAIINWVSFEIDLQSLR